MFRQTSFSSLQPRIDCDKLVTQLSQVYDNSRWDVSELDLKREVFTIPVGINFKETKNRETGGTPQLLRIEYSVLQHEISLDLRFSVST